MRRLAKAKRGQFVVVSALIIGIIVLSTALSIYQMGLNRQYFRYKSVRELVLGITSDFDRCLAHALSLASKKYFETWDQISAIAEGDAFIWKWVRSISTTYSNLGLEMLVMSESKSGVDFIFDWGSDVGRSSIRGTFSLNVTGYGYTGWIGESAKYVMLKVYTDTIENSGSDIPGSTTVDFNVMKEMGNPASNLNPNSLIIYTHMSNNTWRQVPAKIESLEYKGGGNYTVRFSPRVNQYTHGLIMTVITPEDNIYVSARYYKESFLTIGLQSLEDNGASRNLGQIQLGSEFFQTLPAVKTLPAPYFPYSYILKYTPYNSSYAFLNWTTAGDIYVRNASAEITSLTINGNGTVTAFYYRGAVPEPTLVNVSLDSRDWTNSSFHLGNIMLGETTYTLPQMVEGLTIGDYPLQYTPDDSSYTFLWWEAIGEVIPWNNTSNSTTLTVYGDGTVVAVYVLLSEPIEPVSVIVDLQSLEDNGASSNLGQIQLGNTSYQLPNFVNIYNGTYLLTYTPHNVSYAFLNWTTIGDVSVSNPYSSTTSITINGNGTVTAFYRWVHMKAIVLLDSLEVLTVSPTDHLGNITLGSTVYNLPSAVTVLIGDYPLVYAPHNSSYEFLSWKPSDTSGNVVIWDSSNNSTTLTVQGNGDVIALYWFVGGEVTPPPSPGGLWHTLYVDEEYTLHPPFMVSGRKGKLPPSFSTGRDKQVIVCYSPQTPRLALAQLINVTAYIWIQPPERAKEVTLEFGFTYNGLYYMIGNETFPVNERGVYYAQYDIKYANWTDEYGVGIVPEGSVFSLKVTVTWIYPDIHKWGTVFLFYGGSRASRIELGAEVVG